MSGLMKLPCATRMFRMMTMKIGFRRPMEQFLAVPAPTPRTAVSLFSGIKGQIYSVRTHSRWNCKSKVTCARNLRLLGNFSDIAVFHRSGSHRINPTWVIIAFFACFYELSIFHARS